MPSQYSAPLLLRAMLALIIAAVILGGCARIRYQRGYLADPVMLEAVMPGVDNRESVEKMLGHPSVTATFDNGTWYYVSQKSDQFAFMSPQPIQHSVTAVRFSETGAVIAVDRFGLEDIVNVDLASDETPTRGKEVSLLAQLFGNIGRFGAAPQGPRGGGPN